MKALLITILILFIATSAYAADDWDTIDKCLFTTFTSLQIADCLQTRYIFEHPEEHAERNLYIRRGVEELGNGFIPIYFGTYIVGTYLITDRVPSWLRKTMLILGSCISIKNVNHNYTVGVRFAF